MKLQEMLENFALTRRTKTLFEYINEEENIVAVSYEQFYEDVMNLAVYLQDGYGTGVHIGILAESSYIWQLYYHAIQLSGNVAVIFNYSLEVDELSELARLADVTHLLHDDSYFDYYQTMNKCCALHEMKMLSLEEIRAVSREETNFIYSDEEKLSLMLFSSGTSGASKAVMLSLKNVMAYNEKTIEEASKEERVMCLFPVYHSAAFCVIDFAMRKNQIMCITREIKYLFKDIAKYLPDYVYGVPAMAKAMAVKKKKGIYYLDTLQKKPVRIITAGAPLTQDIIDMIVEQGIDVGSHYGMTETGNVTVLGSGKSKTVGRVTSNKEVRIDQGEICVRGDNVMLGYYKNPEETARVLDPDGWMHTGDVGYVDENRYLYITGRKKNLIILSNGENVSPESIEEKLAKCSLIKEIVVLGINEQIGAQIYYEPTQDDTGNLEIEDAIRESIQQYNVTVPTYQQIHKIEFRKEPFEKTSTGKIKRYLVI